MNDILQIEERMENRERLIRMLENRRLQVIENLVERYQKKEKRKSWHKILQ
jgi:hypothetical protein